MLSGSALAVAFLSAGLMGLAIQRGATCLVAAIDEAIVERKWSRAGALAEAAVWVGGLIAVMQLAGFDASPHAEFPVGAMTVAGGALLGAGAWINRACVFGSVARIGSGQWAWLATPAGFFLGCLIPIPGPMASGLQAELPFAIPIALGFAALAVVRIVQALRSGAVLSHLWHPHRATLFIALTFVTTMLSVGAWAYTDALAALARPTPAMDARIGLRAVMAAALILGAVIGGRIAGTLPPLRAKSADVSRCLMGGAMMGLGGQLVPGSNDGLIMLGLPLMLAHAWVAVAIMALTVAALILFFQRGAKSAPA